MLRAIQADHMRRDNGTWMDIGYSFLIGGDGVVYEGRGWGKEGAHTKCYNRNAIGISFIGNFQDNNPSAAMIKAAQDLIKCGISQVRFFLKWPLYLMNKSAN